MLLVGMGLRRPAGTRVPVDDLLPALAATPLLVAPGQAFR